MHPVDTIHHITHNSISILLRYHRYILYFSDPHTHTHTHLYSYTAPLHYLGEAKVQCFGHEVTAKPHPTITEAYSTTAVYVGTLAVFQGSRGTQEYSVCVCVCVCV